ncbi:MAG: hypothetical protein AB7I33_11460, partial [Gemmatimonadales bacterium]
DAFKAVAEEVSHRDLSAFFAQWLHGDVLYDYAAGRVQRRRQADGSWRTRVEVKREAAGMIPVEVAAIRGGDTTIVRADGRAEREWVDITTPYKPNEIVVDPGVKTHDWNMLNNRRRSFLFGLFPVSRNEKNRLDTFFSTESERDRLVAAYGPTVWYNDAGGITLGWRRRSNYLGRFEQNTSSINRTTGWANDGGDPKDWGVFLRMKNPVQLRSPRTSQTFEFMKEEGRTSVLIQGDRMEKNHLGYGPVTRSGVAVRWLATDDLAYLDPGYYEDAGTVEGQMYVTSTDTRGGWQLTGTVSLGGGLEYLNAGAGISRKDRYDVQGFFRGRLEGIARRRLTRSLTLAIRGYAGGTAAEHTVVKQRQLYLGGADPYGQLYNPFTRSTGGLLVRKDVNYHTPGDGNVRGYDQHLSGKQVYALNAELERRVLNRPRAHLFQSVGVALFGDAALSDASLTGGGPGEKLNLFADGGIGLRIGHRIGDTRFVTRFDLPLYVSRPYLATRERTDRLGLRWVVSVEPAF